jgi:hypothetical protein
MIALLNGGLTSYAPLSLKQASVFSHDAEWLAAQIRVLGSAGMFTRSIVNPQRRCCSAALTSEYSCTLDHRQSRARLTVACGLFLKTRISALI